MAVAINVAVLKLVNINALGQIVDKDDKNTTLLDIAKAPTKDFRVIPNDTTSAQSPNAVGFPTIEAYLEAEAASGFALAHMDQSRIVTQMIT